ncbi:MAG: CoA ester lyase [Anaerolineae bacterium]|nr:CoA ester lyase [Anaerolineae bacterium]
MPVTTRRALMFMPGDDRHKIEKGARLQVDSIIMDFEDGVALNNKAAARVTTAAALCEIQFGNTEKLVRINPVSPDGLYLTDLTATVDAQPDGYVLPKTESAEQLATVDALLNEAEHRNGWTTNSIGLIALIETTLGVVNLREIAISVPRLRALAFGAEDLAGDMGAIRTPDGWEVFYARSAVVLHAKAAGLQAIDTPFVDLRADDSQLMAEAEQAMYMGYTGKLAIHPRQVGVIQQIFTPTAVQIDHARRLIEAHDLHQTHGVGVFVFEGKMVDMPMIRAAQHILHRARAAGITV